MPHTSPDRMLMVYHADQGLFNAINEWAHKFFSPATYECPLCRYTYGLTGMLMSWKILIEGVPFSTTFHYRPEFWKTHPEMRALMLPLILVEKKGRLEVLLTAREINAAGDHVALVNCLQAKLGSWQLTTGESDGASLSGAK